MEKKSYYKYLFVFNGLWACVVSIPFIIFYDTVFTKLGIAVPSSPVWIQLFLCFVALFGIGYLLVSEDLNKNHGIVYIGIASKVIVFSYFLSYLILGELTITVFGLAVVDLIGAVLMIEFLLNFKNLE